MHFHGYIWSGACGPRSDFHTEVGRRPPMRQPQPGDNEITVSFIKTAAHAWNASDLPPMEIAHWLLRSEKHIKGTFEEPSDALPWLMDSMELAYAAARDGDDWVRYRRVLTAGEELSRGQSVSLGWYLTGQRFASVAVIACSPNNYYPELKCPGRR